MVLVRYGGAPKKVNVVHAYKHTHAYKHVNKVLVVVLLLPSVECVVHKEQISPSSEYYLNHAYALDARKPALLFALHSVFCDFIVVLGEQLLRWYFFSRQHGIFFFALDLFR